MNSGVGATKGKGSEVAGMEETPGAAGAGVSGGATGAGYAGSGAGQAGSAGAQGGQHLTHGMDPFLRSACEAIGEVIEFWGFKKDMGMVWTYLYLTAEEATAQDLREYFQISTGQTSTVLQGLVEWGVVARHEQPGRQADTYSAQTDLWPIITKVWRERELRMVLKTRKALDEAHSGLRQKTRNMPLKEQKQYREAERRIADLARLAGDGERAIRTFLELSRLDFNSVVRFPRLRA